MNLEEIEADVKESTAFIIVPKGDTRLVHQRDSGASIVHLMHPATGQVERRWIGSRHVAHMGAVEI